MDFKNFEDKLVTNCAVKHKTAVNTSLLIQKILKKLSILLSWGIAISVIAVATQLMIDLIAGIIIFLIYAHYNTHHDHLSLLFPGKTPNNNWVVNMSVNANNWKSVHSWLYFSLYMDAVILIGSLSIAIIWALIYFLFIVPQKASKYIN
jgi:hypothetical protein